MTPDPRKRDWSILENVYALLETDGRILTEGEKELIAGQKKINGIFVQAIDALLSAVPDESASPAIMFAKEKLKDVAGKEPPGC